MKSRWKNVTGAAQVFSLPAIDHEMKLIEINGKMLIQVRFG